MRLQQAFNRVYKNIIQVTESRLDRVGVGLVNGMEQLALERKIYDLREFMYGFDYTIEKSGDSYSLIVFNDKEHSKYVLGGKVPSWTPLEPLEEWVERKGLAWTDKNDKEMSTRTMAVIIRNKIKEKGIEGRNIFKETLDNKEKWIYQEFEEMSNELR